MAASLNFELPIASDDNQSAGVVIMWCDDQPSNNAYEIETLKKDGVTIHTVESTKEAQEWLKAHPEFQHDRCFRVISDKVRIEDGVANQNAAIELIQWMRTNGWMTPILVYTSSKQVAGTQRYSNLVVTSNVSEVYNYSRTFERPIDRQIKGESQTFKGATFCLSGTFSRPTVELENIILAHSGILSHAVNAQVTHLVCSGFENASGVFSAKLRMATDLKVPMVSEAYLYECIKSKTLLPTDSEVTMASVSQGTHLTSLASLKSKKTPAARPVTTPAKSVTAAAAPPTPATTTKSAAATPSSARKRKISEVEDEEDEESESELEIEVKASAKPAKRAKTNTAAAKPVKAAPAKKATHLAPSSKKKKLIDHKKGIWEADRIVDEKTEGGRIMYLVKWHGYGSSSNTWEPEENVTVERDLLDEWKAKK